MIYFFAGIIFGFIRGLFFRNKYLSSVAFHSSDP